MTIKDEQASNSEFINILSEKYPWIFLYTIKNHGNTLKPFDIFWCWKWRLIALEGKYRRWKDRPTAEQVLNKLEPHQVTSLYKIINNKASWGVVCYYEWEFIKYELQKNITLKEVDLYSREK